MLKYEIPKSEIIDQAIEWLYRLGALRAGLDLQVWEKIAAGEDTAETLAAQEGWNLAGVRALLDTLCTLELLTRDGERYCLAPESAYYLIPDMPTYKGGVVLHEFNWEADGGLADAIRSGVRPVAYDAAAPQQVGLWLADYSRRWVYPQLYFETDENLWRSLGIRARDYLRVLDLACGPAPISLALARQHVGVRLTWVDWAGVLQTALQLAASLGVLDQVSPLSGDLWAAELGSDTFDVAYLGNVTHFFSPEENTHLFRRVYAALSPGGTIVINSVARREAADASVALWLYAATSSGDAYDFNEYKVMLENAGFTNVQDINQGPIKALKP
jgi:2-polyprenyl-3-methyl-5-hydroxy-6-metoxy-1,4-benzoquinol methylase